jgi:hypothetical protein
MSNVVEVISQITSIIEVLDQNTITNTESVISIVSEGTQGPPGAQGLPGVQGLPGTTSYSVIASENLSEGDLVNVWNNAEVASVQKADGTNYNKDAQGFVLVGVTAGTMATVYPYGLNNRCSGLTPGTQFLSGTIPGKPSSTPASGTGSVVQQVGFAVDATTMNFISGIPIIL